MYTFMTKKKNMRSLPEKADEREVKERLKRESFRIAEMEALAVMNPKGSKSGHKITVHQ